MTDSDRSARLSALSTNFQLAVRRAQELERSGQLSSNRSMALYGLLMQATAGDCRASKPPPSSSASANDEGLKWMAWKKKQGMSREQAMLAYIDQMDLIDEELSSGGAALVDTTGGNAAIYSSQSGLGLGIGGSGGDLYSSWEGGVSRAGVLYKQRDVFKGWRPRYFILRDKLLCYYLSEDDPVARGQLILEGCRVQPLRDGQTYSVKRGGESVPLVAFSITHPDSSQAYHLATTSQQETDEWMRALKMAAAGPRRVSLRRKTSVDARLFQQQQQQQQQQSAADLATLGGLSGGSRSSSFGHPLPEAGGLNSSGRGLLQQGNAALVPPELTTKVCRAMQALLEDTAENGAVEGGGGGGWELAASASKHDVTVYRRAGVVNAFRGEGRIAAHPVSVLLAVMDLPRRACYDAHFEFGRRVKMYNAHTSLDYHHYRAVWPTSARDLYNVVHWQVLEPSGAILVVAFSDDAGRHPEEAGCVRAECLLAGWVIRPAVAPGGGGLESRVSYLLQTDLKGTLPASVKNMVSEHQPLIIASLRKFLAAERKGSGSTTPRPDLYACSLATYTNQQVEQAMDALNRRVLAADAGAPTGGTTGSTPHTSPLRRGLSSGAGVGGGKDAGGGAKRAALHQRAPTIAEIQSALAPHIEAQVEDAVYATLEREASFPFRAGLRRPPSTTAGGGEGEGEPREAEGWELVEGREEHKEEGSGSRDWSYLNERDVTDVSVLNVCTEGVIRHPPAAVLKAITTLDLVNIWSSAAEFSTHDVLFNVHTWVTYQRLKAMFPMPTRDVCQLVHWRVTEDYKRIVVVAVDDASHPEEEGYVRAHQNEGWVLDAIEVDGAPATRVFCIFSLDIKGIMTKAIRRELTEKQAGVVSSVRKFLDEYLRCSAASSTASGREGSEDVGMEGVIPRLEDVPITNAALQPLVLAWNRWSPTLIPDRIRIEPSLDELRAKESRLRALSQEGDGGGGKQMQLLPAAPVTATRTMEQLQGGLARSVSAPTVPQQGGGQVQQQQRRTPRYTLAPSPVLPPQTASIHTSGSSAASSSLQRSSSPMGGGPVALEGQSRPPRHRVPYAPIVGSKLRESASEPAERRSAAAAAGGGRGVEEEEDGEEEELRRVAALPPSRGSGSIPGSPLHAAHLRDGGRAGGGDGTPMAGSPARWRGGGAGTATPTVLLRGYEEPERTAPSSPSPLVPSSAAAAAAARAAPPKRPLPPFPSALGTTLQLTWLLLPVLVYYCLPSPTVTYRGPAFLLAAFLVLRRFARQQAAFTAATSAEAARRTTEWGQGGLKSRVQVRFPVEVRRIKRYIEAKQREMTAAASGEGGGLPGATITVLHVCMRALGVALQQIPELNGHRVLGAFYPSPSADVSCELRLRDGTYALLKVPHVGTRPVADIARLLELKRAALSQGRDPYYRRRRLILRWCPPALLPAVEATLAFLGAGLGLAIPALGVRSFPQGGCVVLTSPAVSAASKGFAFEGDFVVEPEPSAAAAGFLTPMVLTIGAITSIPKLETNSSHVGMVPVLNLSLMVNLPQHGGASLQHVRRVTDLLQHYMSDPRLLDAYEGGVAGK